MTIKSLFITGSLALFTLSIASAKSYSFSLDRNMKIGATELKAGEYEVKLDGTKAIISKVGGSKSWTVPAKIENAGKKFDQTVIDTRDQGGAVSINEIDLEGSTTRVEFGQ